ncbi:MAG: alpha/beta hydrolase [Chloroflexi bacterium]|uniref:Alpha/beta hydrolase n=1 Tax=Candidatus Chlorohelix allophototropha TaxID=3003348 RepID=A0A8T7LYR3_9CHLR|nr:alpha/beta hydrolase [Chloroflexota bacterium]WJW65550.1 alpha/beta hydrolase [Chloroflexota bacterium L227-S17]
MSENVVASSQHDIELNGINLHYATWGEFSVPEKAVILVHGLSANGQSMAELGINLAQQGYFAIAPDLRGRGLSAKPPHGYGVPFHANDLLSLCDALELPKVNLVGHSLGAVISLFTGAIHPKRIGKVVLIDAGGKVPPETVNAILAAIFRIGQVYPSMAEYLDTMFQHAIYPRTPFWENYLRYDSEVYPNGTVSSRVPRAAIDEELGANSTLNGELLLTFLKQPTLIAHATVGIVGPDTAYVLPRDEALRISELITGSRVVAIPDSNHYTIATSEVLKQEIAAFLAE